MKYIAGGEPIATLEPEVYSYNPSMLEILFCLVVGVMDGDTLTVRCGAESKYQQKMPDSTKSVKKMRKTHY